MNHTAEFNLLLDHYIDGTATAEEVARLDELLRSDPLARRIFSEHLALDSALASAAADWAAAKLEPAEFSSASSSESPRTVRFFSAMRWVLIAACLAIVVSLGISWRSDSTPFATVAGDVGTAGLGHRRSLRHESVELQAGTVELVTSLGARVVIEAPAAFRFESAQRLRLVHGRVAADVPPAAKGFTVVTPTGSAVDLGTKFGVDVPRQGAAEIHVFEGEVVAQSSGGGARQNLRVGEAFALQRGAGAVREIRGAAFIRPAEIADLIAGLTAGQRKRAEAAVAALRRDPALIALLDFEAGDGLAGTYRMAQGRWPGSRAPEFVNVGERLKLDVGGERAWPKFTLATWVRIDQLGAPYQSLYHTDGWHAGDKPGQVHWMINRNMTMRLALRGNTVPTDADDRFYPDSRTSVLAEQGRWMHLAVVYDSDARTVRFYLNGQFDKQSRQEIALPARFGSAQIGNWDANDRRLSGRIDELLILGRAMSDDEIHTLFAAGSPYQ